MNKRQKKKQIKMRNKKLVELYPFVLPRNVWTDKLDKDYNYEYTLYDCIPDSWRKAFGEFLLEDLREALIKYNYLYDFRFMQIKEKYASLRLYCGGAPQEVHDILSKYEYISQSICYYCGKPEATVVDDYGWYLPICEECWDKHNAKLEGKGYRIMSYQKAAGVDETENVDTTFPSSYIVEKYSKGETIREERDISDITTRILKKYNKRFKNKNKK